MGIIAELNERFGLNLGPEHRLTIGQMMDRLHGDEALGAAARVNTRENVRLAFDQKVEQVIQEIVDSNFELYKRITDDRAFGETVKNVLFDHYPRAHRSAEELLKRRASSTLAFEPTNHSDGQDDGVTATVLATIAALLNTDGGDLLVGVADGGSVTGLEGSASGADRGFAARLERRVRDALGDHAAACIDASTQAVDGKAICVVSCRRGAEAVFLKHEGPEAVHVGDFFVRKGSETVRLSPSRAREYVRARFTG